MQTSKELRLQRQEKSASDTKTWAAIANEGTTHLQLLYTAFLLMLAAGLLLLAKQSGLVQQVKPLLLGLRQSGYFLSTKLIEATLTQAGE